MLGLPDLLDGVSAHNCPVFSPVLCGVVTLQHHESISAAKWAINLRLLV
jgi:hypothetical protein